MYAGSLKARESQQVKIYKPLSSQEDHISPFKLNGTPRRRGRSLKTLQDLFRQGLQRVHRLRPDIILHRRGRRDDIRSLATPQHNPMNLLRGKNLLPQHGNIHISSHDRIQRINTLPRRRRCMCRLPRKGHLDFIVCQVLRRVGTRTEQVRGTSQRGERVDHETGVDVLVRARVDEEEFPAAAFFGGGS